MFWKQVEVRKKVVHFFCKNPSTSYRLIAKRTNVPKSIVIDIINNFKTTQSFEKKLGSGRKKTFHKSKKVKSILRSIARNPNQSQRDLARKFKTSRSYIKKVLKNAGIKAFHKKNTPKRSLNCEIKGIQRAKKLVKIMADKNMCIIKDDETYCKADFSQLPGQQFYYENKDKPVDDQFKYIRREKFASKFLVWQAICSCGMQSSCFVTKKTLTANLYIKEYLQKTFAFYKKTQIPMSLLARSCCLSLF